MPTMPPKVYKQSKGNAYSAPGMLGIMLYDFIYKYCI